MCGTASPLAGCEDTDAPDHPLRRWLLLCHMGLKWVQNGGKTAPNCKGSPCAGESTPRYIAHICGCQTPAHAYKKMDVGMLNIQVKKKECETGIGTMHTAFIRMSVPIVVDANGCQFSVHPDMRAPPPGVHQSGPSTSGPWVTTGTCVVVVRRWVTTALPPPHATHTNAHANAQPPNTIFKCVYACCMIVWGHPNHLQDGHLVRSCCPQPA